MSSQSADGPLLFGLLALQNGLVSREQLVAAFAKWSRDKSVPFDEVLIVDGALQPQTCAALRHMVELHLRRHDGDPRRSLMTLPGSDLSSACRDLEQLDDSDLQRSLAQLPESDGQDTHAVSIGEITTSGGRFRILRPLAGARGGMGVINVALDAELGRQVALKQIRQDKADHEGFRRKFQVEAEITGNLEHPGIVPIYGLGTGPDGRPYYAMRLVHGDDLNETIRGFHDHRKSGQSDYNSVEFRGLIDRLIDAAQAIRYAHSRGVLHRDLKPGNILVGEYGETLVIDWGLARLPKDDPRANEPSPHPESLDEQGPLHVRSGSDIAATLEGSMMGTLGYAPPEQVSGHVDQIDERSDVYALGAILYQMLTGHAPISGVDKDRNLSAVMQDTIEGRISAPRDVVRSIPKALSAVCMKALSRIPADRYETVDQLITELEQWEADQPVAAAPDSLADRMLRLFRRYRSAALAGAAALLGVAIVSSAAFLIVNRARINEASARKEAESLAKRNQNIVDVFVDAFRSPDPANEGVTHTMTALEVLEKASEGLRDNQLAEDPLAKASLLGALGSSFTGLGEFEQALSAHQEAFRLRATGLGANHPDTLTSMNNLANSYDDVGQVDQALSLLEETFELRKAELGHDHLHTLNSMGDLALAYALAGQLDEAIRLYEEELKLREAKFAPEHPDTITSMNNLGLAYEWAGRLEEALPLYEQTLEIRKRKLGPDHPDTLKCMNNLANGYRVAGRLDEAVPLLEETLKLQTRKLGPDHPETLKLMNNLAVAYGAAGRLDESISLREKTLEIRKATLGPDHPNTITSMNNLGMAYDSAGRVDEALPLLDETLRLLKELRAPDHPHTLGAMNNLAVAYQSAGRLSEALALLKETLELKKAKLGPEHPDALLSQGNLAGAYRQAGWLDLALPLDEETLRLRKSTLGPDHPDTLISMNNLALVHELAGRLDQALPLYEETVELMRGKLGPAHPHTHILTRAVQRSAMQLKQYELAEDVIRSWLDVLDELDPPQRKRNARATAALAAALFGQGELEEAIATARLALEFDELSETEKARAENVLGSALAQQEKWTEAEPMLTNSCAALIEQLGDLKAFQRWYVPRACQRVIDMYLAWGKPDKVNQWREEFDRVNAEIDRLRRPVELIDRSDASERDDEAE